MKRFFSFIVLLCVSFSLSFAEGVKKTYKLITSADEVTAGKYLIAAKSSAGDWYALGYQNETTNRDAVPITVSDNNTITTSVAESNADRTLPYEIILKSRSDGWDFIDLLGYTSSDQIYLQSSTSTNLRLDGKGKAWVILDLESDGAAFLRYGKENYLYIATTYNNFVTNFNRYDSKKVYLFKETTESVDPEEPEEPIVIAAPTFSPQGGTYEGEQSITLTAANDLSIYYTLDDSALEENFIRYKAPITLSSSAIVRAYAQDAEGKRSEIVSVTYTITEPTEPEEPEDPTPETPTIEDASTPAVWTRAFYESFDKNDGRGGNDGRWNGNPNEISLSSHLLLEDTGKGTVLSEENVAQGGWSMEQGCVFEGSKCLIISGRVAEGNNGIDTEHSGELISPELNIEGTALLRFKIGAWDTDYAQCDGFTLKFNSASSTSRFVVDGSESVVYHLATLPRGDFMTVEVLLTGVQKNTRIRFCTSEEKLDDGRYSSLAFIDEVEIYSLFSAGESAEWTDGSFLSGEWSASRLAELLNQEGEASEEITELDLESAGLQLGENFTVDNTDGTPNLVVRSSTPVTVSEGINVVGDALVAENTELVDLENFSLSKDVSTGSVSYVRSFSGVSADEAGGWSVLCLPFAANTVTDEEGNEYIPYIEWMYEGQPSDKGFYWLKTAQSNTNSINEDASSIEANTPYLIAFPNYQYEEYPLLNVPADGKEFTFSGEGMKATLELEPGEMNDWQFQSNYQNETTSADNRYALNTEGSAFEKDIDLQAFRPYVIYKSTAVQSAPPRFLIGEENTPSHLLELVFPNKSFSTVQVETMDGALQLTATDRVEVRIYTVSGVLLKEALMQEGEVRLFSLAPGVYIVNGQKVVVFDN